MNLSSSIFVLRWLVRDTFRQARSSGIFWFMLGVSAICIVVCLSVSVSNLPFRNPDEGYNYRLPKKDVEAKKDDPAVDVIQGEITFGFGAIRVATSQYRDDAVRFIQWTLTGMIADTLGVLLALIWTAGFLPSFLAPGTASVLLAKPIPRWTLFFGKFFGVLVFVAFQVTIFATGTWLALGISTGYWDSSYLLALPILLIHFTVFFSFSAMLAVMTRSTVTCIFGSLVFWLICWGMNYGHHVVATQSLYDEMSPAAQFLMDAGYWILPKPSDFGVILVDALDAGSTYGAAFDVGKLEARGMWLPALSILSSCGFALVILIVAAREWVTMDY